MTIMNYRDFITSFSPRDARESADKALFLELIERYGFVPLLARTTLAAHFTASSLVFNRDMTKMIMVYHKVYHAWSWTGGHADGDADFHQVARREAQEETGLENLEDLGAEPSSLEALPVLPHVHHGLAVPGHLHLNLTFLFQADEGSPLRIAPLENEGVRWVGLPEVSVTTSEEMMRPVYEKNIREGERRWTIRQA